MNANAFSMTMTTALLVGGSAFAQSNPVQEAVIPYAGVVQDNGGAVTGLYDLRFALYDSPTGGVEIWSEEITSVDVAAGRFGVELGLLMPFPWRAFNGPSYLAIAIRGPNDPVYRTLVGRQRFRPAPGAVEASNGVPIGTIIDWWRSAPTEPIPVGYELCDGGAVFTPGSPILGRAKPDLRGRVTVGANEDLTLTNAAGGSHDLVADPVRAAVANGDSEAPSRFIATNDDGVHAHAWAGYTSSRFYTWDGGGNVFNFNQWGDGFGPEGSGQYALNHNYNPSGHIYFTNPSHGAHSHAITITPQHVLVPYVGVLKLIRGR